MTSECREVYSYKCIVLKSAVSKNQKIMGFLENVDGDGGKNLNFFLLKTEPRFS